MSNTNELEVLRRVLAQRLADEWRDLSHDEQGERLADWLWYADCARAAVLVVVREARQRSRVSHTRRFQRKGPLRNEDEPSANATSDDLEAEAARWAQREHAALRESVMLRVMYESFTHLAKAPFDDVFSDVRHRWHVAASAVIAGARADDLAEFAHVFGTGKTNAPQLVAALALANLGWRTGEIAAALATEERVVGDGETSSAKDKAQVRRMIRRA